MAKQKKAATIEPIAAETNESVSDQAPQSPTPKKTGMRDDALDLEEFNYENLTGDSFQKYVRLVGDHSVTEIVGGKEVPIRGELQENTRYDFVLMKARPIIQDRFPGMEKTPKDYVGLIAEGKPIHTTRIPVKVALEYNRQILNAHSRAGHGKYYFLKK